MERPLHVLLIEDSEDEASSILTEFKKTGYTTLHKRVNNQRALEAALSTKEWEIIISGLTLASISGLNALKMVRQQQIDIPFIFVSEEVAPETVAEAFKAEAQDYILKNNMAAIGPAVIQALQVYSGLVAAGKARREHEYNFRNLMDNAPVGLRVVTAGGETLYANKAVLEMLGYSSFEELALALKEKTDAGNTPNGYEVEITRKDGNVRYLQVFRKEVIWRGSRQIQVLYRDVTEIKQTRLELQRAEEKFNVLFDSFADGIAVADKDGVVLQANGALAKMTDNKNPKAVAGLKILQLIAAEEREKAERYFRSIASGESPAGPHIYSLVKKDGSRFKAELRISPLPGQNGGIKEILVTFREIAV